jgi:ABC-2 type transport system ATP-binding protein
VLARGRREALTVRLDDLDAGLAALTEARFEASRDGDHLRIDLPADRAAEVTRALADRGLYLTELRPEAVSLEDVFLELTREPSEPPAGSAE